MVDVRPFRGLRYSAKADPAHVIAPPYDVISGPLQSALYARSPHNIVRVEYGEQRPADSAADNRYTRAAHDLQWWLDCDVLARDGEPALYVYRLEFEWAGRRFTRYHTLAVVRLEAWEKGVVRPHERTLSAPKSDRLDLLRATGTQVSPVYAIFDDAMFSMRDAASGTLLYDFEADGQRHRLSALTDADAVTALCARLGRGPLYIADGHHRYETALAYRDERRAAASSWSGDEPENFVLMALTESHDPGLLVLPTHRLMHQAARADGVLACLNRNFSVDEITGDEIEGALGNSSSAPVFVAAGLVPGRMHRLELRDADAVRAQMPADQPDAWKRLDVNVLQYGVLAPAFGIDDVALAAGGAVSYTQDATEAVSAVNGGTATAAFILRATPVDQVMAVADASARMPQKSTYFHPKLPTGLVMYPLQP